LGNYRQHLTTAGVSGALFAWGTCALTGLHWLYSSVAALLATVSGLLPDLDHPVGVELKGVTGVLATITALAVWHHLGRHDPNFPFELHLWSVVVAYVGVRFWLRSTLAKLMVHRGISHSLPACAVWGALTYLYYPSSYHIVRIWMSLAVMLGFLSHLVLDEMFSVDLNNQRLKTSFGTALKFWAPSALSTVAIYAILFFLVRRVVDTWPSEPLREVFAEAVPTPELPWDHWDQWPGAATPDGHRFSGHEPTLMEIGARTELTIPKRR
jgi:hypothetical protein